VAAGAAGIGAAALKAFNRQPGERTPNYLLYTLFTALGIFAAIVLLAYISMKFSQPHSPPQSKQATEQKATPSPVGTGIVNNGDNSVITQGNQNNIIIRK
jgi:hypothetical protein